MIQTFKKLFKSFMNHKTRYLVFLFCLSFENILKDYLFSDYLRSVTSDLLTRNVSDCLRSTVVYVIYAAIILAGASIIRECYINENTLMECGMRGALMKRFAALSTSAWHKIPDGGILENLNGDVSRAANPFKQDILDILDAIVSFVISFTVLLNTSLVLASGCLGIGLLCGVLTRLSTRRIKSISARRATDREAVTGFFVSFCEGARTIKRLGCLPAFQKKHIAVSDQARRSVQEEARLNGRASMARDLGRLMTEGGIIAAGSALTLLSGSVSLSSVIFASGMGYSLYYSINELLGLSSVRLRKAQVSAERILNTIEDKECFSDVRLTADNGWALSIENLSFSYEKGKQILNNCSMRLEKGKVGVIAGSSGCGKSTLLKVIAGALDGYSGLVKTVSTAYVPQANLLYNTTIAENISFDSNYDSVRMNKCTYQAHIHDAILEHEGGFQHQLVHKGTDFSSGQLKRISIARGLYADKELLLLDEMTAGLDSALRDEMISLVKDCADKNKTVLMVSHDLEVIRQADVVFYMEDGIIRQQG